MNISTGGPHLLIFERDQQLTALLISEFQLAGYECHTARTAVEVFDAIARFPIRLVLVNLAQAAAGRREFWVALDTQRRGRGVQVFTFLCTNLAGYGPQDIDERAQPVLVDMHVDGMLGLMNLVEAVRSRVPGTAVSSNTNTQPRIPRASLASPQAPTVPTQTTGSFPPVAAPPPGAAGGTSYRTASANTASAQPIAQTPTIPSSATSTGNATAQQSYTDKIRAVLYPHQRSAVVPPSAPSQEAPYVRPTVATSTHVERHSTLQQLAEGQINTEPSFQSESGLDQLSRMLQERRFANNDTSANARSQTLSTDAIQPEQALQTSEATQVPREAPTGVVSTPQNASQPSASRATPSNDTLTIQTLRASPIQDLPRDQRNGYVAENARTYESDTANGTLHQGQSISIPLASITMPIPPVQPKRSEVITQPQTRPRPETIAVPSAAIQATEQKEEQSVAPTPKSEDVPTTPLSEQEQVEEIGEEDAQLLEQLPIETQEQFQLREPGRNAMANSATLLDIVQSLPPMPSPSQIQPQALQGRATRSLGSVLLEGHLVPQSRLEVAQNIQRMLRGVDLNYQLGEILLMFKLLTPDQLLAASLVSYGLITTQQIVALGHIRQELHSIGLEYDLENLLILFRILTPEQLREVRSSWQS